MAVDPPPVPPDAARPMLLSAASGGVGLSSLASLLARGFVGDGRPCVLVDADLDGGGLDVLLGVENDGGLRWRDLDVNAGIPDARSLTAALPRWDGVPVLALRRDEGDVPSAEDVVDVVLALAAVGGVVVDVGRAARGDVTRGLSSAVGVHGLTRLLAVELSVPGLARARGVLACMPHPPDAVVGMQPRGMKGSRGMVLVHQAAEYLGMEVLGPIPAHPGLCSDLLSGLGASSLPRQVRRALADLMDAMRMREVSGRRTAARRDAGRMGRA